MRDFFHELIGFLIKEEKKIEDLRNIVEKMDSFKELRKDKIVLKILKQFLLEHQLIRHAIILSIIVLISSIVYTIGGFLGIDTNYRYMAAISIFLALAPPYVYKTYFSELIP